MIKVLFMLTVASLLTACDAFDEVMKMQPQTTMEMQPGSRVQIDGESVFIQGTSRCHDGRDGCVVITPDTELVDVLVAFTDGSGSRREVWTVERADSYTMLRRADGSYVAQAD